MKRLVGLYPRRWRERYGEEFTEMLAQFPGRPPRLRLGWDVARGAFDAHLREGLGMKRFWADTAMRRGLYDGLMVAGLIAVFVVLTNVVFPGGPEESDGDPEYLWQYLITLIVLAGLLVTIGIRGGRRAGSITGGLKAGAVAGAVLGLMITLIFLAVNNLFLDIVSRQHDKRVAFASSGWTSMRAYLTVTQLQGGLFLIPALAAVGGLLGLLGAIVVQARVKQPSSE